MFLRQKGFLCAGYTSHYLPSRNFDAQPLPRGKGRIGFYRYSLQSMPGKFSGLHLLCYEYVAFQQVAPGKDIGFDLSSEFRTARSLFDKKAAEEK